MTNNEANEKYLEYLEGHIGNVKEAFDILCTLDIPFINENKNELLSIVSSHDESKYEEPEWSAYLHHFYPTCDEDSLKTEEFEEACKCHIHNNPHHWDYWVEDGKLIDDIDEHEYKLYTVERLCDHMAMSIQNNNKPADWYYANKDHIIMPDYGYEFYEDMLAKIPEDYDLSFHGTRTDGKPERDAVNESILTKQLDEYGNSGYVGQSKSVRAYGAEDEDKYSATECDKLLGVRSGATKACLVPSEWHHTGSYYKETDYYDIRLLLAIKDNNEETISEYDKDEIKKAKESLEKLKSWRKPKLTSNTYRADVEWLTWSGTRKHPKATKHSVKNVDVEERGSYYYFNDEYGTPIKKMIGSNGTYVNRLSESVLNEDAVDDYIKSLEIDEDSILNDYDAQISNHYKYIRQVGRKINKAKYDNERNMLKKRQDFYKEVYKRLKDMKSKQEDKALNESTLLEAKASQLRNKTKSEDPARVKKSKNVKTTYIGMSKFGILNFKTTSESRNGYHYQTVEFQSLKPFEELIKKNGKIIPTDVEKAFNEQDINVYCSDESFTYWAWYHQAYQNDYAYIDDAIPDLGKRLQAPKVNNVRLAGALCKHLYSVLEYITRPFVLLAISDDMNNFLNQKPHKYAKQTVATQNWYDAVKQWTSEDALEYLGLTKEQIIMDLSKTLKVNPTINLDDFVDDLVKDAILKRKDDIDPKLERDIANKVIDELDLEAEYENLKPEEVEHEEDIK